MNPTPIISELIICGCACFLVSALVAAAIPVDPRKLPRLVRLVRMPFVGDPDRNQGGLATSILRDESKLPYYRLALGALVLFFVFGMLAPVVNTRSDSGGGGNGVLLAAAGETLFVVWIVFILIAYQSARIRQ
jgi:hypothetical protein